MSQELERARDALGRENYEEATARALIEIAEILDVLTNQDGPLGDIASAVRRIRD